MRRVHGCIVVSLIALTLISPAVLAQSAAGGDGETAREPEAIEIMRAADRALAGAAVLEFDFQRTGTHAATGRTTGHAVVERGDGYQGLRYRASISSLVTPSGLARFGPELELASDGDRVWLLDHRDRVLHVGSAAGGAATLQLPVSQFVIPAMFRDLQSVEIDLPERMMLAGVDEVGGVECDVVYLDFPDDGPYGEQYFWIGRRDRLPRRVVFVAPPGSGTSVNHFDFIMSDVSVVEPDEARFRLEAPADYRVDDDALTVAPGAVAEDWELTTAAGETVRIEELRGNVVVLDFWASWCPICRNQLPMVSEVAREFDGQPVEFFGINAWETGDPLAFLEEIGATIPVVLEGDDLAARYRITGTATMVIIGPDGRFRPRLFGNATRENLVDAIRAALPGAGEEWNGAASEVTRRR